MGPDVVQALRRKVEAALEPHPRVVLAVSGGVDSMTLLDAAAAVAPTRIAAVATFDHASGEHARAAVELVTRRARDLGLAVVVGRAERPLAGAGEAAWREARWRFLRAAAADLEARVATGHARDDQVETMFLRALRDAGARGLAGLYAPSPVVRPLLDVSRAEVERYAAARGLAIAEDPTNRSRAHLRNRARLDLLPLLQAHRPALGAELLGIARRAAEWRRELEALVDTLGARRDLSGVLHVAADALTRYDAEVLCLLWPALAARAGVTLDWRGTRRLAEFTSSGVSGQRVPLSGGFEVVRRRDAFLLRPSPRSAPAALEALHCNAGPLAEVALVGALRFGRWRFAPVAAAGHDPWTAELPGDRPLHVRGWRPGDRMRGRDAGSARRVKRFLADARVPAELRPGWPVVVAGDEIVWIPGVRRSFAATDRSGRPGLTYFCEHNDDVV